MITMAWRMGSSWFKNALYLGLSFVEVEFDKWKGFDVRHCFGCYN